MYEHGQNVVIRFKMIPFSFRLVYGQSHPKCIFKSSNFHYEF